MLYLAVHHSRLSTELLVLSSSLWFTWGSPSGLGINVPRQLQNTHYDGDDALIKGQNYKYPHDYKNHYVEQQYLPDDIKDHQYYYPGDNKFEKAIKEYWQKIKKGDK